MAWIAGGVIVLLLPASVACGHQLLLTLVGRLFHRRRTATDPQTAFLVLIPAHDEQAALPRSILSVYDADYPPDLVRVLVVADNCSDDTAGVAVKLGAECVVRTDPERRGKGFAVAHGLAHALSEQPDAVLFLDADCTVSPGLFRRIDGELRGGAVAVQAAVVSRNPDVGPTGFVAAVGTAIDNGIAAGADRLGFAVPLRGTGMTFSRALLVDHPWTTTGLTEDAEYDGVLRKHHVGVRFLADETVFCDAPERMDDLFGQRRRWRAALGVPGVGLTFRLLTSKPLILLHLTATTGAVIAGWLTEVFPEWCVFWLGGILAGTAALYLRAVTVVGWRHLKPGLLLRCFGLVVRLGWVTATGFWQREKAWTRTPRTEPHRPVTPLHLPVSPPGRTR